MRTLLRTLTVTAVMLGLLGSGYIPATSCGRGCCCCKTRTENPNSSVPIQARGQMGGCGCIQTDAGPGTATLNSFVSITPGGTVPDCATAVDVPLSYAGILGYHAAPPGPYESPPIYKLVSSYLC